MYQRKRWGQGKGREAMQNGIWQFRELINCSMHGGKEISEKGGRE